MNPRELFQKALVSFPFPLNDGTIVRFHLPSELSRNDAERIKAYIDTLVTTSGSATEQVKEGEDGVR